MSWLINDWKLRDVMLKLVILGVLGFVGADVSRGLNEMSDQATEYEGVVVAVEVVEAVHTSTLMMVRRYSCPVSSALSRGPST